MTPQARSIYAKELWALTPEARTVIQAMVSAGYEHDLAVTLLSGLCGERIYALPEEPGGDEDGND